MKRKFKLLTSVASLCLAVALMAFGVYAAARPTVSITGTVTFQAKNVFADVEVYKYVGASKIEADGDGWTKVEDTISFDNTDNAGKTVNIGELGLDDTNLVAQYKIVVKNTFTAKDTDIVYVKVAQATANGSLPTGVNFEESPNEGQATTAEYVYVATYTVTPEEAGATFDAINLTGAQVTISREAIPAA